MFYSLVYIFAVPMLMLLVLMTLIWAKGTGSKLKATLTWGGLYLVLTISLASLAATQYVNGCGFGLGDCYAEGLPDGFFGLKMLAVMGYYLWLLAAALSVVRRVLGVKDTTARKYGLIVAGVLTVSAIGGLAVLNYLGR